MTIDYSDNVTVHLGYLSIGDCFRQPGPGDNGLFMVVAHTRRPTDVNQRWVSLLDSRGYKYDARGSAMVIPIDIEDYDNPEPQTQSSQMYSGKQTGGLPHGTV